MPVSTRISVQLDITAEEAVRQLEGGKAVTVRGGGNIIIIPNTHHADSSEWRYRGYVEAHPFPTELLFTVATPQQAIEEAAARASVGPGVAPPTA